MYSIFTSSPSCALDQRPEFGAGDAAELLHLFRGSGHVEDEAVGLVADIVVDDFQHVDVTLVARGINNRILKRGFTFPLCFVDALDSLFPRAAPEKHTSR